MPRDFRITSDANLAVLRFSPYQLTRARELRGLTKTALAKRVDKSVSAISQFESGEIGPDAMTLQQLAVALQFPIGFFARQPYAAARPELDSCHFRSLRSVSQARRREAIRIGELMLEVVAVLEQIGVRFPTESVSPDRQPISGSNNEIESIAEELRQNWGLGFGPILNPITLLERKGVWVLPLQGTVAGVDAFSTWIGSRPFVFLGDKQASRMHFDAMHELAHLLFHEDVVAGDMQTEQQANRFASSFLLPRRTFVEECPTRWNLAVFQSLKREWRVSIQALIYRAQELGMLSRASAKRAYMELNKRGMRKDEGAEWDLVGPQALTKALALAENKLPLSALANELAVSEDLVAEILASPSASS